MPRIARAVAVGVPHHITQRGNNRQDVFFLDQDRHRYLTLLCDNSQKFGLEVVGYCLMANHVHLIAVPQTQESLAKVIGRTDYLYTQYVNRLHDRSGHLWQNRFFSCPLDERHLWTALRYVERNPVRAGLVRVAWEYPWSSALAHVSGSDTTGLLDLAKWQTEMRWGGWKEVLVNSEDHEEISRLRNATSTGRPLGSDSFVSKLERLLGRRLRPMPEGRPRKAKRPKTGDCP